MSILLMSTLVLSGCRDRRPERAEDSVRYPYAESARAQGGAWEKEIQLLSERVARDPNAALELASLASLYVEKARRAGDDRWLVEAEKSARRSLVLLPSLNEGAQLVLAQVAQARHDFAASIDLADGILRANPSSVDAMSIRATSNLARGHLLEAERDADRIALQRPSTAAYTLRGTILEAQGRDDEAMFDYRAAILVESIGENSSSAWARALMGRQHLRRGRLKEARAALEEAMRASENYPLAVGQLVELDLREKKIDAALERLEAAVVRTGASAWLVKQGEIFQVRGDREAALAKWKEAEDAMRAQLAISRAGHRGELARLLLLRDGGGGEDAKEALVLAQEEGAARQDWESLRTLAHALERNGHLPEARVAIRSALSTGVREPAVYRRAAAIERASGRGARGDFYDGLAASLAGPAGPVNAR